ncbi:MAG TPA: low molecular weight protein-tyrosine-phosphatase [Gemmatimonadales bacterium]|nr:low molecular weight protein-tyrosine-phosphatase [Gemmatimonadales bacterium]
MAGPKAWEDGLSASGERWRNLVDAIKSHLDHLTHSRHRNQAQDRLRRAERPKRVLIVCSGNICRSPYAEACFRRTIEQAGIRDLVVESAGFFGPDRPAHERGSGIARRRGIDLSQHRSRLIPATPGEDFDLILAMTRRHRDDLIHRFGLSEDRIALLGDFDVADPPRREIGDPYGQPDQVFEAVFAQIERSIEGWFGCLPG